MWQIKLDLTGCQRATCQNCGKEIYIRDNKWYHVHSYGGWCDTVFRKGAEPILATIHSQKQEEVKMENETVSLRKEDLLKAHAEGCSATKKALENLYPEVFPAFPPFKKGKKFVHVDSGDIWIAVEAPKSKEQFLVRQKDGRAYSSYGSEQMQEYFKEF